jgi:hypothetical protein
MVFRILKNFVKVTVLITIGAGIGIWFSPPTAKVVMKQKLTMAQGHTKKFQTDANKLWTSNFQKKFTGTTKNLDPRNIDKKTVDGWIRSGKNVLATIAADVKKTQDTVVKANQVIQSAKSEYRQYGTMFGM